MDPSHIKLLSISSKWNNFLTFFGLNSVKEIGRDINNVRYVASPIRMVYCASLSFLFLITFIYQLKFVDHVTQGTIAWNVLSFYLTYSGSCEAILLVITSALESKKYGSLLASVIRCEFKFSDSKAGEITKRSAILLVLLSFILIGSFTNDLISRINEGISFEMVLNMLTGYTFLCYNIIIVSHFGMAQFWLQKSFRRINEDLEKIGANVFPKDTIFTTKDFKTDLIKNCNTIENIKNLRLLYNNTFNVAREIDGFFATRIVIVIFANLLMCTILLFYALQKLSIYLQTYVDSHRTDMLTMFKAGLVSLASMSGFIWPAGSTCKEAYKTAFIIQDHLVKVKHEEIKAELKAFAMQVQQEKVCFSPHGLFVLENRMILAVLAAITSYLVILIQLLPQSALKIEN